MEGTISVFNTGAENLLQYRAEEVIEKATPEIFLLENELEQHRESIRLTTGRDVKGHEVFLEYARQGRKEQQEWTYIRKDGTHFPAVLSISALRDPEGVIYGFLCIAMDVTEKRRSEKALAESEANYRFLIDNIPNVVFRGYADGSLDLYDDKIETMTGYQKRLFDSRKLQWFDLILEEDRPQARQKFIDALKTDKSYIREYRIRKKTGEIIWIEACSKIVCDEDGNIDFITGSFLDVSERSGRKTPFMSRNKNTDPFSSAGRTPFSFLIVRRSQSWTPVPAPRKPTATTKMNWSGETLESLAPLNTKMNRYRSWKARVGLRVASSASESNTFVRAESRFMWRLRPAPPRIWDDPPLFWPHRT